MKTTSAIISFFFALLPAIAAAPSERPQITQGTDAELNLPNRNITSRGATQYDIGFGWIEDWWICDDNGRTCFGYRDLIWTYGDDPYGSSVTQLAFSDAHNKNSACNGKKVSLLHNGAVVYDNLIFQGCGTNDVWISRNGGWFMSCHQEAHTFPSKNFVFSGANAFQTHHCWQ
ncbi:hypothetical protein TARUN_6175 [Trichoderma arundinaceum]|uniref:Uncharacterized protein n=1 Tax=Trichoderma arundinaceum TaxID=490622 RepID=A0A395NJI6_TRIAR|nr:hypothetical protein TARUN_6175 [Trichoderma arundinaceum]